MATVHYIVGTLVLLGFTIALVIALVANFRKAERLGDFFWTLMTTAEGLFGVQVLLGILLYMLGHRPLGGAMHIVYGLLVFLAVGADHMLRPGGRLRARLEGQGETFREPYTYSFIVFLLFALAGRAWMTGRYGF